MKKEIKLTLRQLNILQKYCDLNIDFYRKEKVIKKEAKEELLPNCVYSLKSNGEIDRAYYQELLTEEENKIINFNSNTTLRKLYGDDNI